MAAAPRLETGERLTARATLKSSSSSMPLPPRQMGGGVGAHQGPGCREGRIQHGGVKGRQGSASQPGAPAKFVERDQGGGFDQALLLELPDETPVRIILEACEIWLAARQG
jgi:hypothetical protein